MAHLALAIRLDGTQRTWQDKTIGDARSRLRRLGGVATRPAQPCEGRDPVGFGRLVNETFWVDGMGCAGDTAATRSSDRVDAASASVLHLAP